MFKNTICLNRVHNVRVLLTKCSNYTSFWLSFISKIQINKNLAIHSNYAGKRLRSVKTDLNLHEISKRLIWQSIQTTHSMPSFNCLLQNYLFTVDIYSINQKICNSNNIIMGILVNSCSVSWQEKGNYLFPVAENIIPDLKRRRKSDFISNQWFKFRN